MLIIKPSYEILGIFPEDVLPFLERIGRVCYKSEDKITEGSAEKFVHMILNRRHESVIEHASMSVKFVCDRGVTHELVRHRLCAFSQESTRYCNYSKGKFGGELTVIDPCFWSKPDHYPRPPQYATWVRSMENVEEDYLGLLKSGAKPQEARDVLPNSLKTEIVTTANLREWRHIFTLRTSEAAHPQMREIMCPLLKEVRQRIPILFDEIGLVE